MTSAIVCVCVTTLPRCRRRVPPYHVPAGDSPLSLHTTGQEAEEGLFNEEDPGRRIRKGGLFKDAVNEEDSEREEEQGRRRIFYSEQAQ